jgi:tetratricopeptide (TPR) repeat protein
MPCRRVLFLASVCASLGVGCTRRGPLATGPGVEEARIRELDIAFYQARVDRDPTGAIDLQRLGTLYLQRGRAQVSEPDFRRAEAAARRSLANGPARHSAAWQLLAAGLAAQHRFEEARDAARMRLALEPGSPTAASALGEILLELGEYPAADSVFVPLGALEEDFTVGPRLARWHELRGRVGRAHAILVRLRDSAVAIDGLSAEHRLWLHLRLGDLAVRFGRLREAHRELHEASKLAPEDPRVLGTSARLAFARRRYREAIDLAERALSVGPDPSLFTTLADAHRAVGETDRAESYLRGLEASLFGQTGPIHRAWSLTLLDHGRDPMAVLRRARRDLEQRKDVYGWDVVAWALFRCGRVLEASEAMREALRWGTEDPLLHRHARAIAEIATGASHPRDD